MTKIFEADPSNALLSFAEMMKKKITMPAHLMFDGQDRDLYVKFSRVAQRIGVYTVVDYAEIIDDLVQHWQVSGLTGLTSAAEKAQDYLCALSERYQKLASRVLADGSDSFSWIYGRTVA
jgi:acyl-[acyl-carrier-protein] desaturase